jgi:pectate lyase-like protein
MRQTFISSIFLIMLGLGALKTRCQGREEFNGPFSTWADVKRQFGARGDGKNDDTKALQAALDQLCISNPSPKASTAPGTHLSTDPHATTGPSTQAATGPFMVIYLPAGTYCISSTLVLKGKLGVSIIGEDPARTTIKWIGNDNDTLLWADGSSYFKISRLTWDANGRQGMEGVGIHWKDIWNDGKTRSYAPLNIEISDNYFIGGFTTGLGGGTFGSQDGTGANDSEITVRRCLFNNCSGSGILIKGYNALDYWIWDCRFLACGHGIGCSYGGYHAYRCFFSGSKICDASNSNGYYNALRGCYSTHSMAFSIDQGYSTNPFKRIFQDNTIVSPTALPIEYYHSGKITLMGNRIDLATDTVYKVSLNTKGWAAVTYEVLSMHNTYGYAKPIRIGSTPNKIYAVGDRVPQAGSGIALRGKSSEIAVRHKPADLASRDKPSERSFLRSLDPLPPTVRRKIFDVPPGADAAAIQSLIDQAARLKGQRPVIHFGFGTHLIDRTLVIPPASDMQLIGDGFNSASAIVGTGQPSFHGQPLLLVKGPAYITIKDIQIGKEYGKDNSAAIVFENVDQPASQAHLDQVYAHADTSLFMNGMDNLYLEKNNSFFTAGNCLVGGPRMAQGKGTAKMCCYGGQFAFLSVQNGAQFLAKDCWWEGNRQPLNLQGKGNITIDGAMIAFSASDTIPTIRIGKFAGKISLLNMYVQGTILPQAENKDLSLLVWNIYFFRLVQPLGFLGQTPDYKGAFLGLNSQCFGKDPACMHIISIDDQTPNVADTNQFLDDMTAQDRENMPLLLKNLPSGVSNIYLSRVNLGAMNNGIIFNAKGNEIASIAN